MLYRASEGTYNCLAANDCVLGVAIPLELKSARGRKFISARYFSSSLFNCLRMPAR